MALDRIGLLARTTLDKEEVKLPDGETVIVRCMTVAERDRMERAYQDAGKVDFRARLIVSTVCDADGVLVLTPADFAEVGNLPFSDAELIVEAAIRMNRMGDDEKAELGKGSEDRPSNG
jgi:hypothetical protein